MPTRIFTSHTHRRWRSAIANAQGRVLVFSPYLTSRTAEWVIGASAQVEVHTCFKLEAFLVGASSLSTLTRLLDRGHWLFHVPDLHAKVVTDRATFLFAGSQNLTTRGTRNRELTLWTDEASALGKLNALLAPWINARSPVTAEMVADAMQLLGPLQKQFQQLQTTAAELHGQVEAARLAREELRRREFAEAEAEREKAEVEQHRSAMLTQLEALGSNGNTPLELARSIVRNSIWWTSHSSRKPVRAPGHAERVSGTDPLRKLELGANYFVVGAFIQKARATLIRYFERFEAFSWFMFHDQREGLPAWVIKELVADVQSSVEHKDGSNYQCYRKGQDGYMRFGTQAVSGVDCVQTILAAVSLRENKPNDDY